MSKLYLICVLEPVGGFCASPTLPSPHTSAPACPVVNNFRESYLIMYNLWQLLGFAVILGKLALSYRLHGQGNGASCN